jgi:hypothetical protein
MSRSTLQEQIDLVERLKNEDSCPTYQDIFDTLRFLQKWEMEIRAALPTWKAVREDPTLKALATEIPIASIQVRDASE